MSEEARMLTKAEEEIMHHFWEKGQSSVSDIILRMDDPKPPHSSISTIVRILERKGFLGHEANGRAYEYFPLVEKEEYSSRSLSKFVNDYFDGSFSGLVSFIAKEQDLDMKEFNELMDILHKK